MINGDTCDLLITGATVFDGSGGAGLLADVAVTDGQITAVGALASLKARDVMIADGKALAPGFIDTHAHSDAHCILGHLIFSL